MNAKCRLEHTDPKDLRKTCNFHPLCFRERDEVGIVRDVFSDLDAQSFEPVSQPDLFLGTFGLDDEIVGRCSPEWIPEQFRRECRRVWSEEPSMAIPIDLDEAICVESSCL